MGGARRFAVSRRELLVLAVGVSLVVLAVGAAQGLHWLWERGPLTVSPTGDVLAPPTRLNVNEAAEHELMLLPGIGPATAAAIVRYRTEHGLFPSFEALTAVRGIGPKTLERIRPHAMCARVADPQPGGGS